MRSPTQIAWAVRQVASQGNLEAVFPITVGEMLQLVRHIDDLADASGNFEQDARKWKKKAKRAERGD
jgi:acyl carrier protein phosphodiesterase